MRISVSFDYPPIPVRDMDFSAIDSSTYDGAEDSNCPIGRGATRMRAVFDLLAQTAERNDDRTSDDLDYAVMMAREVMAEDAWRLDGKHLKPADMAEIDRIAIEHPGTSCREQVEEYAGEALS